MWSTNFMIVFCWTTKLLPILTRVWFNRFSETTESRSTSPQIYSAPVSSQSQTNSLASLSTPAVSLGLLQSQVSSTPYGYQPQITSFLHQFEQFANKSVRIDECQTKTDNKMTFQHWKMLKELNERIKNREKKLYSNFLCFSFAATGSRSSAADTTIVPATHTTTATNITVNKCTTSTREIVNRWTG